MGLAWCEFADCFGAEGVVVSVDADVDVVAFVWVEGEDDAVDAAFFVWLDGVVCEVLADACWDDFSTCACFEDDVAVAECEWGVCCVGDGDGDAFAEDGEVVAEAESFERVGGVVGDEVAAEAWVVGFVVEVD